MLGLFVASGLCPQTGSLPSGARVEYFPNLLAFNVFLEALQPRGVIWAPVSGGL